MSRQTPIDSLPDWAGFDEDLRRSPDVLEMGTGADFERFGIDGVPPERVVRPVSVRQVRRIMEIASARGVAVVPAGFGTHLGLGASPRRPFAVLSLALLNTLVDHQPANMTLTAQAGVSLARIQDAVAGSGQWLPVDPPLLDRTSVGGLISANLAGPHRFSQGTVRDLLVGITVVRPDGSLAKSGGRVVKNVAGYDLGKLYCGALGTLGVVVEATFKLRTLPEKTVVARTRSAEMPRVRELLQRILTAPLEPMFIELVAPLPAAGPGYVLVVGFAGPKEDVADQAATLRSLADGAPVEELSGHEAAGVLAELRDSRVLGEALMRFKVSLLPTRAPVFVASLEEESITAGLAMTVQVHAGNGIVHVRVERPEAGDPGGSARAVVERLRAEASALGGTLVVEEAAPDVKPGLDLWGGNIEGLALMRRIKQNLDPGGILSPGRFVDGIR